MTTQRQFDDEIPGQDGTRLFAKIENIGDGLEGFLVKTDKVHNARFGKEEVIADLRHDDGTEESITLNADLLHKFASVKVGDYLKIEFVATKDTGKASPMKVFSVRRAKNPGTMPARREEPKPSSDGAPKPGGAPF